MNLQSLHFQARQLNEILNSLAKPPVKPRNVEQKLQKNKDLYENGMLDRISGENSSCSNLTADSTATGHILRCFSDSSGNSSALLKNEDNYDIPNIATRKTKRPFLRKGSGLMRYMPKSVRQSKASKITNASEVKEKNPQFERSEQAPFFCSASRTSQVNRVRFKDPELDANEDEHFETEDISDDINNDFLDINNKSIKSDSVESDDLRLQGENEDLAVFEQLERCAQNASFSSDCSVVQRVLLGEINVKTPQFSKEFPSPPKGKQQQIEDPLLDIEFSMQTFQKEISHCHQGSCLENANSANERCSTPVDHHLDQKEVLSPSPFSIIHLPHNSGRTSPTNPSDEFSSRNSHKIESSPKINLFGIRQELCKKQKQIGDLMLDIEPSIETLKKEISRPHQGICVDNVNRANERCSTPVDQHLDQKEVSSPSPSVCNSVTKSPTNPSVECLSQEDNDNESIFSSQDLSTVDNIQAYAPMLNGKDKVASSLSSQDAFKNASYEKSKLKEKMEELEKEIEVYQARNIRLSEISKEREEISKKLKKEYDGIEKYKEEEKKKLQIEIEEERRQLKRQKETFNRFQKLRKDNPSRKEREELSAARQEVEKLQEELKRQRIKCTSDIRRMKNQLIAAEKERDTLKLKYITLEEQCEDLLTALKNRNSKKKALDLLVANTKFDEKNMLINMIDSTQEVPNNSFGPAKKSTKTSSLSNNRSDKISSILKNKVRFNLVPQFEKEPDQRSDAENGTIDGIESVQPNKSLEDINDDSGVDSPSISEFNEPPSNEIRYDDKVERCYPSGDREIIFSNGIKEIISVDEGTSTIYFPNGDSKVLYPDKRETYIYASGVIEKKFPSGLKVTEFPNGQIESHHSDGFKETKFPDGAVHYIYSDRSEKMIDQNGSLIIKADGTKILEKGGEKQTTTKEYKKREYLDGSMRIVYKYGRTETRYSNGRMKIKDKNGKVIYDSKH